MNDVDYLKIRISNFDSLWLDTCTRCGICIDTCPLYVETRNIIFTPIKRVSLLLNMLRRSKVKKQKILETDDFINAVFGCLLCDRCSRTCPFGIRFSEVMLNLRTACYENKLIPRNLILLEKFLSENHNPYGIDPKNRLEYIRMTGYLKNEFVDKNEVEVIYFPGCTASYIPESQKIVLSTIKILDKMKLNWSLMSDERCCGKPLHVLGNNILLMEFADHNFKQIIKRKAKYVVTNCPTCRSTLKYLYPKLLKKKMPFEVLHVLELVYQKIRKGELKIEKKLKERITYHDPCDFARFGEMLNEPRYILSNISKNFAEMPDNRLNTLCCGGGGLLEAYDNNLRSYITKKRIEQAISVNAEILVVSCPACKMYLDYISKAIKSSLKVVDMTEIIADLLE
ncbi:MAG: (Fe-S)-binding protein [Saccharolobus sp.]|uniref:(Fe-S)-binding protein n=1 Tax=Saccharolobus sp. TaxID=2100761 RepID=UPI00317805B9